MRRYVIYNPTNAVAKVNDTIIPPNTAMTLGLSGELDISPRGEVKGNDIIIKEIKRRKKRGVIDDSKS